MRPAPQLTLPFGEPAAPVAQAPVSFVRHRRARRYRIRVDRDGAVRVNRLKHLVFQLLGCERFRQQSTDAGRLKFQRFGFRPVLAETQQHAVGLGVANLFRHPGDLFPMCQIQ